MTKKLYGMMNWPVIEEIVYGESQNPHETLGAHPKGNSTLVQAYYPDAKTVDVFCKESEKLYKMEKVDEDGFFAVLIPEKRIGDYEYIVEYSAEEIRHCKDPYIYKSQISEEAEKLFLAGIHYEIYDILGAHPMEVEGTKGVQFAVWAPNAMRVSVVGDFNGWDGRIHQMRKLKNSGIFELFIPDVCSGQCYKYEVKAKNGTVCLKADPYGISAQLRPDNASIVPKIVSFKWQDARWINQRKKWDFGSSPVSVYELYLGSFARKEDGSYYNYRELADVIIPYVKKMGYTHIELMPIMEHPFDGSWGYQVIGYYAPTARYGDAQDFKYFVNEMHKAGIGVILDWVPAHFPKDAHGLAAFDGTCLYEHKDKRQGEHPHWGTLIYNYGRPEVKNYLIANALYWVEQFHVDGIRMDAVASMLYLDYGKQDGEWIANIYGGNENLEAVEFLKHLNSVMKKRNPGVMMIAEESTAWPQVTGSVEEDHLGFDLKWNMGWMNDYLSYISQDPYFRSGCHNLLTFSMLYCYSEKFMLVFSHDEVVHGKASMIGKMPGTREEQFANLRLTFGYQMAHPGKKLVFMGQDIGEFDEWNENRQVQWELLNYAPHLKLNQMIADLNQLYRSEPALYAKDTDATGFEWINCITPQQCMLSFMRKSDRKKDTLLVVANFANMDQTLRVGVPYEGKYTQIFHSDDEKYGGKNMVCKEPLFSESGEWDGKPYSICFEMPALSICFFRFNEFDKFDKKLLQLKKVENDKALKITQKTELEAELAMLKDQMIADKKAFEKKQKADNASLLQKQKQLAAMEKQIEELATKEADERKKYEEFIQRG